MLREGAAKYDDPTPRTADDGGTIVLCPAGTVPPQELVAAIHQQGHLHVCIHEEPQVMAVLADGPVRLLVIVEPQEFESCEALLAAVMRHYPAIRVAGLTEAAGNGHEPGVLFNLLPGSTDESTVANRSGTGAVDDEVAQPMGSAVESEDMSHEIHQSVIRELHGDVHEDGGTSSPWLSADELAMLLGQDEVDSTTDVKQP